jgi:hypothetical protein
MVSTRQKATGKRSVENYGESTKKKSKAKLVEATVVLGEEKEEVEVEAEVVDSDDERKIAPVVGVAKAKKAVGTAPKTMLSKLIQRAKEWETATRLDSSASSVAVPSAATRRSIQERLGILKTVNKEQKKNQQKPLLKKGAPKKVRVKHTAVRRVLPSSKKIPSEVAPKKKKIVHFKDDDQDFDDADDIDPGVNSSPAQPFQMLNKPRRRMLRRRLASHKKAVNTTWNAKPWWPQLDLFLVGLNEYLPNEGGLQQSPGKRTLPQLIIFGKDHAAWKRLNTAIQLGKNFYNMEVSHMSFVAEEDDFLEKLALPDHASQTSDNSEGDDDRSDGNKGESDDDE